MRIWLALVAMLLVTSVARAQDDDPTILSAAELRDEHVRKAIAAIVEEIYRRQDPDTFWDPASWPAGETKQLGGYTALTVLALLQAGESYQDPRLRGAIEHLERLDMDGTYAVAVRASVWAKLPPRFNAALERDTRWLLDGFSERAAGWNYRQEPNTSRRDNSITQYGALALWEAAKRGQRIEARYWRLLEQRFIEMQLADGGWNYAGDGPASGSMTTAGLATLFITLDLLHAADAVDLRERTGTQADDAIALGLEWMDANFSPTDNPGTFRDYYYYLYGVERVGLASGIKFLGGHDWYREGAAELLRRLCQWDPDTRTMRVHDSIAGNARGGAVRERHLAFALMFLSRGRVPVAINKLRFDGRWDNRPRDVANAVNWIAEAAESEINWQIVDGDAEPEAWLDAPILYMASDEAPAWLDSDAATEETKRLKRYLDLGGLLLAVNEGRGEMFADAVEAAGEAMYPRLEWRDLPDEHWAYTIVNPVGDRRPALRGLSNGVRELIILSREMDLAETMQSRNLDRIEQFLTVANIYLYASEKNRPRPRLALPTATQSAGEAPVRATIVRARYAGDWDPEPAALEVFATAASASGLAIDVVEASLDAIDALEPQPALVVVSGLEAHEFTAEERASIQLYARAGGVILFETPGGRAPFTLSAEQAITTLFGTTIRPARRGAVIRGEGLDGGHDLSRTEFRPFSFEVFGSRETTPRLRAMRVDGTHRIFFSREDISNALLDQPCWGVSGYASPAAQMLMENLVRWGMGE